MSKLLAKRKAKDATAVDRRILILDPEKCKPDMPAYAYLCKIQNMCDKECIVVDRKEKKCKINEDACLACLNRGAGQNNPLNGPLNQSMEGCNHGQKGLARSGRTNTKNHIVTKNQIEKIPLSEISRNH